MQQERHQSATRSLYLHAKTNHFCVKFRTATSVPTCELGRFSFSFSIALKLKNFVFKVHSQPTTSNACPRHQRRRRFSFRSKILRVIQRFRTLKIMHSPLSIKNTPNGQFQHSQTILPGLLSWFQRLAYQEPRSFFCGLSAVAAYLSQFVTRRNAKTKAILFTAHSCLGLLLFWVLLKKCTKVKISIVLSILAFACACGLPNQVYGVEKYQQWAWRAWKYVILN